AGPLLADAGERLRIGDGVGAAAAVLGRHRHAEDVVLLRQRDEVMVEAMLDVAHLLVLAQFLAEGIDVGKQALLFRGLHDGLLVCILAGRVSEGLRLETLARSASKGTFSREALACAAG